MMELLLAKDQISEREQQVTGDRQKLDVAKDELEKQRTEMTMAVSEVIYIHCLICFII